jgi:hypothetical protein
MSDMDPDGMDSDFEGEGDLDRPENITDSARLREQQTRQAGTSSSQEKEHPTRSRRINDEDESENEDEEDEDMEPRSAPRSASHTPHNRRESDRNRPSPSGDRRR